MKKNTPSVTPKRASAATQRTKTAASAAAAAEPRSSSFPIVGLGASAGGLEALEQFFAQVPKSSGIGFVVVQHLDPTRKGIMAELLQRNTRMNVTQIKDGMKVQPDHVYVIPPNRDLSILRGELHLLEPAARRGLRLPIDFFLRSLADDQREQSIGVILSGMGSDGTLGLRAIKEKAAEPSSSRQRQPSSTACRAWPSTVCSPT
jgi:chemotaxis response regulator CheB